MTAREPLLARRDNAIVSHNDQRTRIAPLIRKRVDRATNFATKVDLVTGQYPVEEREEIAELLRILAAKPEAPRSEALTPSSRLPQ
jgi:hypothetical protein